MFLETAFRFRLCRQESSMETSLHQSLKLRYAESDDQTEVRLGRYRIDAVRDDELIEIQFGSLGAIRDKIGTLLRKHAVRVVKPIVHQKRIVRQAVADGPVLSRRLSPKRGELMDIFADLVFFTRVFPHPRLVLEVPLVNVEHWRLPPDKRRRRWRSKDYKTKDYVLEEIESSIELTSCEDLLALIDGLRLPDPFDTAELAQHLQRPRTTAQQIAYCLRNMGALESCGKRGNSMLYRAA